MRAAAAAAAAERPCRGLGATSAAAGGLGCVRVQEGVDQPHRQRLQDRTANCVVESIACTRWCVAVLRGGPTLHCLRYENNGTTTGKDSVLPRRPARVAAARSPQLPGTAGLWQRRRLASAAASPAARPLPAGGLHRRRAWHRAAAAAAAGRPRARRRAAPHAHGAAPASRKSS